MRRRGRPWALLGALAAAGAGCGGARVEGRAEAADIAELGADEVGGVDEPEATASAETEVAPEAEGAPETAVAVEVEVESEAETGADTAARDDIEAGAEAGTALDAEPETDVGPACNAGDVCALGFLPACYEGRCTPVGSCVPRHIDGCCTADADCAGLARATLGPCDAPRCEAGTCALARIPGCCEADAACDDGLAATVDRCAEPAARCTHCEPPCPALAPIWTADFEGATGADALWGLGFSVEDSAPSDEVTWRVVRGPRWASGAQAAYLGDPRCTTYAARPHDAACAPRGVSARVQAALVTPPLALPADHPAHLAFWIWSDVEPLIGLGAAEPDVLRASIVPSDGGPSWEAWSTLAIGKSTDGWRLVALDLGPWRGQVVRVRFAFDTFDGQHNDGGGIWLDGLTVTADCVDNSCCTNDFDCAPAGACDAARCLPLGEGVTRACVRAVAAPNVACTPCAAPDDCDDANPCSADACTDGRCTHDAFCCLERPLLESTFAASTDLAAWSIEDGAPDDGVAWHVDQGTAWFGNPTSRNYASDAPARSVAGAIVSPPVALPAATSEDDVGASPTIEVVLALATEWDDATSYDNPLGLDRATLSVRDGAFETPLWTSDLIGGSTHGAELVVRAELGPWRGRTVRFVLAFDSGDAAANDHDGLRVRSVWAGVGCP